MGSYLPSLLTLKRPFFFLTLSIAYLNKIAVSKFLSDAFGKEDVGGREGASCPPITFEDS